MNSKGQGHAGVSLKRIDWKNSQWNSFCPWWLLSGTNSRIEETLACARNGRNSSVYLTDKMPVVPRESVFDLVSSRRCRGLPRLDRRCSLPPVNNCQQSRRRVLGGYGKHLENDIGWVGNKRNNRLKPVDVSFIAMLRKNVGVFTTCSRVQWWESLRRSF